MSDFANSFGSILGGIINFLVKLLVGLGALGIIGFALYKKQKNKTLNIPVTIWIPRSDGKITDEVDARGGYSKTKQQSGGYITTFKLHRKGQKTIDIPPPASRFLVGLSRKLYLIQKGIDDFEPVDPNSFRYVEVPSGKKIPVINLRCMNQDATAWVEDNRANASRRFTLSSLWEKYQTLISLIVMVMIMMIFVYVNYMGLEKLAVEFARLVEQLAPKVSSVSVK